MTHISGHESCHVAEHGMITAAQNATSVQALSLSLSGDEASSHHRLTLCRSGFCIICIVMLAETVCLWIQKQFRR